MSSEPNKNENSPLIATPLQPLSLTKSNEETEELPNDTMTELNQLAPNEEMDDTQSIPDVNVYQQKKTLAQGMMDLALFSANANQLRYVVDSANRHPFYYATITLLSLSLILQVLVGVGLILNAICNLKHKNGMNKANKINDFTVIGIFLVTVLNCFITGFGVPGAQS